MSEKVQTPFKSLTASVEVAKLRANCIVIRDPKKGKTNTQVAIYHGATRLGKVITLGGRWNQEQALREFCKNPTRWDWRNSIPCTRTDATISLGPVEVAYTVIEGPEWSEAEALADFQSHTATWTKGEGWDAALRLGLVRLAA